MSGCRDSPSPRPHQSFRREPLARQLVYQSGHPCRTATYFERESAGGPVRAGGLTYDIAGNVDLEHGHIIRFKVPFDPVDPTSYVLFHHTREDGAVSGYCRPPGQMVGVQADRYIEPYYPPFAPPGPGVMTSFIYAIPANGVLQWFRHDGARHGAFEWKGARPVGVGWADLPAVSPAAAT